MLLFPTIAVVAWLPEFLRPWFGTVCGTACGFDTLGAPDLAFSPECPRSSRQLQRGGLPCPDHPLYSCVRLLILNESYTKDDVSRLIVRTNLRRSPNLQDGRNSEVGKLILRFGNLCAG